MTSQGMAIVLRRIGDSLVIGRHLYRWRWLIGCNKAVRAKAAVEGEPTKCKSQHPNIS